MRKYVLSPFVLIGFILTSIYIINIPPSNVHQVDESHGQSLLEAGAVVLPGDRIKIGEIYRVLNSELTINAGASRSKLKLGSGSRFRTNGAIHKRSSSWTYLSGKGKATVNKFTFVHHWAGTSSGERTPLLVQQEGSIKWLIDSNKVRVVIGDDFVGHWILEERGGFVGIRSSDRVLNVERSPVPSLQVRNDRSESSWKPGSIMSPEKMRNFFHRYFDSESHPSSIKEIFGYWVRDSWGQPYLYVPLANGRFLFASSGPDEQFLTDDDRKWVE